MKQFTHIFTVVVFLLCGIMIHCNALSTRLVLTEGETTSYTICYDKDSANAREAAAELCKQLKAITGVDFPVLPSSTEIKPPFISVGYTLQNPRTDVGKGDGKAFVKVRADGKNLFLTGEPSHYDAVMAFLEGDVHCRFFTPEITSYPKCGESMVVEVSSRTERASFERRLVFTDYGLLLDSDWYRHNRVKTWEHFDHPRDWLCHTYAKIVPPADFAKTPELFAVVNGKPSNTMICPTHPENIRRAKALVRQSMERNSGKRLFSISENDGSYPYCQCERCREYIHAHGDAPIAAHLYMVNEVAKSVADMAPAQRVEFIVYTPVFHKVPTDITMEPNVCMWYCANLSKDIRRNELGEWKKLVSNISVWEYDVDFSNYFHITSMFSEVVEDLKLYNELGLEGIMFQEVFGVRGGDLQRLRAWVLAKLLWNASLDADELVREYCNGVYGAAADELYEYYKLVNTPGTASLKDKELYEFLDRADALFKAALTKTAADSPALKEIEIDYLPVLITRVNDLEKKVVDSRVPFPVEKYSVLLDDIKRITGKYNILKLSELVDMSGYLQGKQLIIDMFERENDTIEVFAVDGRLYNYPKASDPLAEGQRGVTRQFCEGSWLVQWVLPTNVLPENRLYQLEAEFRIEKPSVSDEAVDCGVYDAVQKKEILLEKIKGDKLSTEEYRFIKIGEPFSISHRGEVYVYFAAPATSDVGSFYVNRIRLKILPEMVTDGGK